MDDAALFVESASSVGIGGKKTRGENQLDAPIQVEGQEEMRVLSDAFDEMRSRLHVAHEELTQLKLQTLSGPKHAVVGNTMRADNEFANAVLISEDAMMYVICWSISPRPRPYIAVGTQCSPRHRSQGWLIPNDLQGGGLSLSKP